MERMKPLRHLFEPDPRSEAFVIFEESTGQRRQMTLADHYDSLDDIQLNPAVPESVVNYFNVVKSQYLYGWVYYPFFTTCKFMSAVTIEMALRVRQPHAAGSEDRRTLKALLRAAIDAGILRDDGFPSLPARREQTNQMWDAFDEATGRKTVPDSTTYVEILLESLPKIRNVFAHPHEDWLVMPETALDALYLTVEVINQLWPSRPDKFSSKEYIGPAIIIKPTQLGYSGCHRCEASEVVVREGSDDNKYCDECVSEMIDTGEAEMYKNTSHSPDNPVWQVNYEIFTTGDFHAMLAEDARLPLFYPTTKKLLLFLIDNPEASWQDAATHVQRSRQTTPELLVKAVDFYRKRREREAYQPKGLKQRTSQG
jgi:hypothetical protein